MIRVVQRNQLDDAQYDACIDNAMLPRIYAYSWYLDCVADHWEVLVLDNYKAVMPLPWGRKFMIYYISQPFFTQQLGVFSKEVLTSNSITEFVKRIPKRYRKIALQLNAANQMFRGATELKTNYILRLDKSYNALYKQFSKGRKSAIQQGLKHNLQMEDVSFKELLELSKKNYSFTGVTENEYDKLTNVIGVAREKKLVKIMGVRLEATLIGGAVFLLGKERIIYLFSATSTKGKELQVGSLVVNAMLNEYAETDKVFDFEGSMIPSVASFFKSFGALEETYPLLKKRLL